MSSVVVARPGVLADRLPGALIRDAVLVLGGAALTGLSAQVAIHTLLSPVPFTLQTLAVLLVGAALGPARGALSMLVYLAVGAAGLPWFAGHTSGLAGASAGYVVGFVLAAALVGALARRGADRSVWSTAALMALGNVLIYAVGVTWLALDLHLGAGTALALGVRPFVAGDILKIVVAALALPATWTLVRRQS